MKRGDLTSYGITSPTLNTSSLMPLKIIRSSFSDAGKEVGIVP